MEKYDTFIYEKAFKNYIQGVLYILTGLYLLSFISFYFTEAMMWMKYFLMASCFLNGLSAIIVYMIPFAYLKKLAKPFLFVFFLMLFLMASWLVSIGIVATALWYVVIPLFIYAVFPGAKIIRWLFWYGCMMLSTLGLGFVIRYFYYDNGPVVFPSYTLIEIVLPYMLNIIAAFLFTAHSLCYINSYYKHKINHLEYLTGLKNEERTQIQLEVNYKEQYKFCKIYEQITVYLESTQPYLSSDFKIGKISNDLNINTLYIEKAISLQKNMNFNNFINSYRITYSKKLIRENSQYTLEYIYLSSGFKSQSSFNRAFKTLEGVRPSDYRKQLAEKEEYVTV